MATKERINDLEGALTNIGAYIIHLEDTIESLKKQNEDLMIENLILKSKWEDLILRGEV